MVEQVIKSHVSRMRSVVVESGDLLFSCSSIDLRNYYTSFTKGSKGVHIGFTMDLYGNIAITKVMASGVEVKVKPNLTLGSLVAYLQE